MERKKTNEERKKELLETAKRRRRQYIFAKRALSGYFEELYGKYGIVSDEEKEIYLETLERIKADMRYLVKTIPAL